MLDQILKLKGSQPLSKKEQVEVSGNGVSLFPCLSPGPTCRSTEFFNGVCCVKNAPWIPA